MELKYVLKLIQRKGKRAIGSLGRNVGMKLARRQLDWARDVLINVNHLREEGSFWADDIWLAGYHSAMIDILGGFIAETDESDRL